MNGLSFSNIELTSRCNKSCWMCGRRKLEREYPELCNWGDMEYEMVEEIYKQLARNNYTNLIIQYHNNGESLLYPELGKVLSLFKGYIRCFNTNGKLLMDRYGEIVDNLETLTISVIENDEEGDEQYEIVRKFLEIKGNKKPYMAYRLLGQISPSIESKWASLCLSHSGVIAKRILHNPMGSRDYEKKVTIPEIGICLDLLTHLAIDRFGNISLCVRFDPEGELRIGNIKEITLEKAWTSEKRRYYIGKHIEQKRSELPGCSRCEYFGVPRGE